MLFDASKLTQEDLYWISYQFIEFHGTVTKVDEELQIAAREIEYLQENKPNLISKIQKNLAAIKCPTLILWGEQDSWYPPIDGEKLQSRMPVSKLQILPNCGHDASSGCPDAVNTAILKFLHDTDFLDPSDLSKKRLL